MGTTPSSPAHTATAKAPKVFTKRPARRGGTLTTAEDALITQFVQDQPREVTPAQVTQLGVLLRRSPNAIRDAILRARDTFAGAAEEYVDMHMKATKGAYDTHDYEVAAKASQWALENLSAEGQRVIDKTKGEAPRGPKVMVGVRLGGVGTVPPNAIAVSVETPDE